MSMALTLANIFEGWTYYIVMGTLLIAVIVLFFVLRSRQQG